MPVSLLSGHLILRPFGPLVLLGLICAIHLPSKGTAGPKQGPLSPYLSGARCRARERLVREKLFSSWEMVQILFKKISFY